MADIIQKKKYADLPQTTTLKDNDMVMISDGTNSKVITANNLKSEIVKDVQVDTSNLATKTELNTGLNSKANVGHTHSEYATTTQLSTKADISHNHDSAYATKSSEHTHTNKVELDKIQTGDKAKWDAKAETSAIPTKTSQLTNDSSFTTQTQVDTNVNTAISNSISSGGIKTELDKKADKSTTYTKTEVNALIDGVNAGDVDLTNYYNKTEVDAKDNLKVDKVAGKQLSTEDFTTAEKNKLTTLQNADVTKSYVDTELTKKSNVGHNHAIGDIANFPVLHTVATSGDYNDLINKPTPYTLPTASTTVLGGIKIGAGLSITNGVVSTTGGGVADSVEWTNIVNKPTSFTPSTHSHTVAQVTGLQTVLDDKSDLSHVHAYASLTGKPTIPTLTSQLTNDSSFTTQTQVNSSVSTAISNSVTSGDIKASLDLKVDKVTGKGLSTNDLTSALKTNYDGAYTHSQQAHAPSDAEANVQSDWNVTDTSSDAYIKNKPTIPDVSNYYSKAETDQKITDAVTGGTVDLGNYYTKQETYNKTEVNTNLDLKVDKVTGKTLTTNDLTNTLKSNYDLAYAHSQSSHFSGSYVDLTNKPTTFTPSSHAHAVGDLPTGTTSDTLALGNHTHVGVYEPVITKNTAFNVNFETVATNVKMNGVQSVGSLNTIARVDHVHPNDTTKVDKVAGKSLIADTEIARLASVTNYTHPSSHPANIITQDTNNRFVSDTQVATWDAKEPAIVKNTAFNKNFGTGAGTVAEGNHVHASDSTKVSTSTTINSKPLTSNITLSLDDVPDGTTRKLTNINADTVDGKHISDTITQAQYDAMVTAGTIDPNTIYIVEEDSIEIPTFVVADSNKILAVNSTGSGLEWIDKPTGGGISFKILGDIPDIIPSDTVSVTSVGLDTNTVNFNVGNTRQIVATVLPSNATNKNVTWTTGNNSVATVNSTGLVTGVGVGSTTITVTTIDGNKTAVCNVTVTAPTISVTGVTLDKSTMSLVNGNSTTLTASIVPSNATNQSVSFGTNPTGIVSVTGSGLTRTITANSVGTTTITVTTADGSKTATCNATVSAATVSVSSVTLNKSSTTLTVGGTETLTATILPSDATNKNVTWSSSNTSAATISNSGLITAVGVGSSTITVTTADGNKIATCTVTVNTATVSVTGVVLNKSTLNLTTGGTGQLTPTISPSNATNQNVTWTSGNTSVATVSSTGLVTAVAVGTSVVTVTTVDGGKTSTCGVVVTAPSVAVTGVTLNKSSTSITTGNTEQLTATISPSNATNKNINWTSNNTGVATVSASGLITAIAQGSATITATTVDGSYGATCTVTVNSATVSVTGVALNKTTSTLTTGGTETLVVTISPSNATNKNVTWTSSNTSVATVSSVGLVTGVSSGNATITVTTADGSKIATCSYTITSSVANTLTVNPTSYTITDNTLTVNYTTNVTLTGVSLSTNGGTSYDITATSFTQTSATFSLTGADGTYTCKLMGAYDDGVTEWTPTLSTFGISNDGTNSQATSDGLNAMITYASTNGKSYIKMPAGTYLIQKDTPVNLKSNITLDFNGATFKMEANNKSGYQILILKEVSNVTIKNGTLEGDRYEHDYTGYDANTNSHEFGISVRLDQGSENCIIENMTIKKMSGYGIYTAQGTGYGTTINLNRANLESGTYSDNGVKTADTTKIRYSTGVDISGFASLGYFQVGTYLKYQNFMFNSTRTVTALVFNASNVLVSKVTTQLYRPIEITADAKTAYLIFHQASPTDLLADTTMYTLDIFHMKPNKNCIIRNNVFDDNRCLGLAVCGGWNLLVEKNEIKNTSCDPTTVPSAIWQAGKPGYGIDIEDGWESTEDLTIRNNTFTNNWFGDVVAMAGDGMVIENNTFTRNMHCYSRLTNYTVRNNTWNGGGANYDTEKDYGCTVYGNIYNNTTISGEYYKTDGFTNSLTYKNETVNGGKFINHKSMVLKDSTIDLLSVTSTPFLGSFYNCTIKNIDGTTSGSKHTGIVSTGTHIDTCTVTGSSFFPTTEFEVVNSSITGSGRRIRMDAGTLNVQNNDINGTVIVLNGGTSATIKNNRLSNISGNFITNNAGITVDQSNNV